MVSGEVFNYVAAFSFALLAVFVSWACYRLVQTLEKVDGILNEVKGVTADIEIFKNGLKMGLVTLISALVAKLRAPAENLKEVKKNE